MKRRFLDILAESFQACQQPGEPLLRLVVPNGDCQGLPLADDHHQLLAPCDAGINQVALEQEVLRCPLNDTFYAIAAET